VRALGITMRKITHIVIHTAAADRDGNPVDQSAETLRAYHRKKGYSDIGYHFVIRFDGTVESGRPLERAGAHVQGFNAHSIGICFTGHGDLADFTAAQKKSGHQLVFGLLEHFELLEAFQKNPQRVLGHRECYEHKGVKDTGKSCPGRKVSCGEFRKAVLAMAASVSNA
jgi:N-acetylmuramoyl-L-alanine amidase